MKKKWTELAHYEKILELFINMDHLTERQVISYVRCSPIFVKQVISKFIHDKILVIHPDNHSLKFYSMSSKLKEEFLTARHKQLESYKEVLEYYKKELETK